MLLGQNFSLKSNVMFYTEYHIYGCGVRGRGLTMAADGVVRWIAACPSISYDQHHPGERGVHMWMAWVPLPMRTSFLMPRVVGMTSMCHLPATAVAVTMPEDHLLLAQWSQEEREGGTTTYRLPTNRSRLLCNPLTLHVLHPTTARETLS